MSIRSEFLQSATPGALSVGLAWYIGILGIVVGGLFPDPFRLMWIAIGVVWCITALAERLMRALAMLEDKLDRR